MDEGARPLTLWLESRTDSATLLWASDALVEPALSLVLVLVLAVIANRLVARAIGRAIARARLPGPGSELRRRLAGGAAASSDASEGPAVHARRVQRAEALGALATSAGRTVVWTLAGLVVLGTLGVELGPLVAGAGIVGVALGFGAQNVVRDLLAGVSMLIEDQYGVGDVIDVGDAIGVVEGISLRSTRVRSLNGTLWHVPNGEIRRVGNMTQGWSRAVLDIEVAYGTELAPVLDALASIGTDAAGDPALAPLLLDAPEVVGVERLGADGVTVRLMVRTVPGEQWRVSRELRRRVKESFDAAGIEIPFPQRTVWLRGEGSARD
jgi:small-conductance mechanosensitive channel